MAKITKQEFENWSKDFGKMMGDFIVEFSPEISETEKEQLKDLRALIELTVRGGNTFAAASFIRIVENWTSEETRKKVYSDTDGLTLQQWLDNFKKRLKGHAESGGYYKSNIDLSSLKERWKNLLKLWKNDEERKKVIPFLSDEDRNFIVDIFFFINKGREIMKVSESDEKNSEMVKDYYFLVEDLCGRVEAAQKKLEQAEQNERERERERETIPTVPLSLTPKNKTKKLVI